MRRLHLKGEWRDWYSQNRGGGKSRTRPEKATGGSEGWKAGRGRTEGGGHSQHGRGSHLTSSWWELRKCLRKRDNHTDKDGQERGWDVTTVVSQKAIGLELTRTLFSIKISIISNIKLKFKGEKTELQTYLLLKNKQVQEKQSEIGHSPYPRRPKQFWDRWLPSFNLIPIFLDTLKTNKRNGKEKYLSFFRGCLETREILEMGPRGPETPLGQTPESCPRTAVWAAIQSPWHHRCLESTGQWAHNWARREKVPLVLWSEKQAERLPSQRVSAEVSDL